MLSRLLPREEGEAPLAPSLLLLVAAPHTPQGNTLEKVPTSRRITFIWQNLAILLKHQATLGLKNEGPNVSMMHIQPEVNQSELITLHLGS